MTVECVVRNLIPLLYVEQRCLFYTLNASLFSQWRKGHAEGVFLTAFQSIFLIAVTRCIVLSLYLAHLEEAGLRMGGWGGFGREKILALGNPTVVWACGYSLITTPWQRAGRGPVCLRLLSKAKHIHDSHKGNNVQNDVTLEFNTNAAFKRGGQSNLHSFNKVRRPECVAAVIEPEWINPLMPLGKKMTKRTTFSRSCAKGRCGNHSDVIIRCQKPDCWWLARPVRTGHRQHTTQMERCS